MKWWLIVGLTLAAAPAGAQPERLDRLVARGIQAVDEGRYIDAINALEEAWDRGRQTPLIRENLALAHLYGEKSFGKAEQLMRESLEAGGGPRSLSGIRTRSRS
jgi:hypothetical protein